MRYNRNAFSLKSFLRSAGGISAVALSELDWLVRETQTLV